jgi:Domain of unknown function (DUF4258)
MPNGHHQPAKRAGKFVELGVPIEGRKRVWFTRHLLDQLKRRGVTEDEVIETLRRGRGVAGKQPPGVKRIRWAASAEVWFEVVYTISEEAVVVITVIRKDRGASRRWHRRS